MHNYFFGCLALRRAWKTPLKTLVIVSVKHQERLSRWWSHRSVDRATTWLHCLEGVGWVCRLCCSLCGLMEYTRAWFEWLNSTVQKFGMIQSTIDYFVFYHHRTLWKCIYLIVYVDVLQVMIKMLSRSSNNISSTTFKQTTWKSQVLLRIEIA